MATAKVIIAGQNNIGPAVKSAQGDISSLSNAAQKAGDVLKKAFTVTAIIAALKKLGDGCAECFNLFWEAERKYKQLQIALGDTSAYNQATATIKKLSKQTLSSKSDIESMVSELAALGKNADDIDKISSAAVYLSNVTGKDLNSSMTTLLNTYNGTTTQLKKLGIDVSDLTKEELAQGAAVDKVISSLKTYSEQLSEIDTRQHLTNIKNSWGDIKQSVGDLVNFSFAPMIARLDNALESFNGKFNSFIQKVKIVIANFPEVFSRLMAAIKGSLKNLFSIDGIQNLITGLWNHINNRIKTMGETIGKMGNLVVSIFEETIKGIGNYAMYWITHVTDSMGINISEVINSIGKWLTDSSIGKVVDQIVTKAVDGVRFVGAIIKNLPGILKIVLTNIGDMIASLIKSLPVAIKELFLGVIDWVAYVAIKIKNDIADALSSALDPFRAALRWIGINVGDGKADRTSEKEMGDKVNTHFANVSNAFSDVKAISKEMADEIDKLLSPSLEKLSFNTGETIGQKMAVWTAKSTDEYYKAAQQNFSNIGDFLKDWGQTFLGDVKDGFGSQLEELSGIFTDVFGDDMAGFVTWFQGFLADHADDTEESIVPVLGAIDDVEDSIESASKTFLQTLGDKIGSWAAKITGSSSEKGSAFGGSVISSMTSSLGQAGEVAGKLAQNMATMGPLLGAIATALEYVFQGLSETLGPMLNEFTTHGIEPLKELGRVIGDILLPTLEDVMPLVKDVSNFLIGLFRIVGIVLKPIIQVISSSLTPVMSVISNILQALTPVLKVFAKIFVTVTGTIQYVIQTLQHWVAMLMNWLASLNLMGWRPFEGLATSDPGSPGDYGSYIKGKWNDIDSAFEQTASTGTASTAIAVSSAGYQGATHVTINIYQEAPVVGDGGMRQFARMIRSEWENISYYGVTT